MKLLKPSWMNLDGKPLFAVDVHPDGMCVATGGMGDDCGRIVVWNMAPVRSEREEEDPSVPKMLCELTNHEACVNALRWSPDGKSLASGECVCVYAPHTCLCVWQWACYCGNIYHRCVEYLCIYYIA